MFQNISGIQIRLDLTTEKKVCAQLCSKMNSTLCYVRGVTNQWFMKQKKKNPHKYINSLVHTCSHQHADIWVMEISAFCTLLLLAVALLEINSVCVLCGLLTSFKQRAGLSESGVTISTDSSSVKCYLQGTAGSPVFSMEGDFVLGGVFSIHFNMDAKIHPYTAMPEPPRCTGG